MSTYSNQDLSVAQQLRQAEAVLKKYDLVKRVEECIAATTSPAGRPRELSVRALLVSLCVLAGDGRMHLIRVPRLLNSLSPSARRNLGITRSGNITRRQVERLFNLVAESIEKASVLAGTGRLGGFDALCDDILRASAHPSVNETKSIAVDGTSIASWGTKRKREVLDAQGHGAVVQTSSDPDARWRGKTMGSWKRPVFGFDLTVAVTVPEVNGLAVPLAALSMRFRPATDESKPMGLEVVRSVAQYQGALGDVLVDREYSMTNSGSDFVLPVRALGGEPIIDLRDMQLGPHGTVRGALVIDGQPFSPSTPPDLRYIEVPAVNATLSERLSYQRKVAARSLYALVPYGSRKPDGSQVYQCPASAGKVLCPLMPSRKQTKRGTLPLYFAPATAAPNSVCSKNFTTFHATDLPLSQRELYGTSEWYFSYQRRNRVEGIFGNVKNEAVENLRRGSIRVRGLIKTGLMVAMMMASTNLRLGVSWERQVALPPKVRRGRPAKRALLAYAQVALGVADANAPPLAS